MATSITAEGAQKVLGPSFARRAEVGLYYDLTIDQLLPSGAGRVAAIYSDPAKPSYDECIQKNMDAITAGTPENCVLFADDVGQTPVVYPIGAGQGKGLLLDRSAGLVRGAELWLSPTLGATWTDNGGGSYTSNNPSGTYDELYVDLPESGRIYEVFFDCVATGDAMGLRLDGITGVSGPVGTSTRYALLRANDAGGTRVSFARTTPGVASTATVSNISVSELPGHHQQQSTAAARGEFSRRYNQLLATATFATQSITAIAAQYRLYFTGAGTVTLSGAATGVYTAGSHLITCTAGSLTLTVAGSVLTADLRFEADATIGLPAYQRVTTASDYDEVGFPTYWRAQTDDWAKSHMNPAGATKAYVFWAGQKMSDDTSSIFETSANTSTTAGSIGILPISPNTIQYRSGGTLVAKAASAAVLAPSRSLIGGVSDIAGDVVSIYLNGTLASANNADQGTGTYTEQDVFFASRAGTSLFANIREYAPPTILFLQPADSLSASHLAKLQKGYAKAVGVTL